MLWHKLFSFYIHILFTNDRSISVGKDASFVICSFISRFHQANLASCSTKLLHRLPGGCPKVLFSWREISFVPFSQTRRAKVCHEIAQGGEKKRSPADGDEESCEPASAARRSAPQLASPPPREQSSRRPPDGPAWQQTISGATSRRVPRWNRRITQTTLPPPLPFSPARLMTGGLPASWRRLAVKRIQNPRRKMCLFLF